MVYWRAEFYPPPFGKKVVINGWMEQNDLLIRINEELRKNSSPTILSIGDLRSLTATGPLSKKLRDIRKWMDIRKIKTKKIITNDTLENKPIDNDGNIIEDIQNYTIDPPLECLLSSPIHNDFGIKELLNKHQNDIEECNRKIDELHHLLKTVTLKETNRRSQIKSKCPQTEESYDEDYSGDE